jgi:hypothetical protein
VTPDLQQAQAQARQRARLRPDPGTTMPHPTVKKGVVTAGTVGTSVAVEVDGLPATNMTGWTLDDGDVVLLLVCMGRRWAVGVETIKETT